MESVIKGSEVVRSRCFQSKSIPSVPLWLLTFGNAAMLWSTMDVRPVRKRYSGQGEVLLLYLGVLEFLRPRAFLAWKHALLPRYPKFRFMFMYYGLRINSSKS